MENNEILDLGLNNPSNQGGLTSEDKDYLDTAAKWAKFMAIMGFIVVGLMVLVSLSMFAMGSLMGSAFEGSGASPKMGGMLGAGLGIVYLLLTLPLFFTCLYLYRFATKMKDSLYSSNLTATEAFLNLRNYFRMRGYLVIAILALYLLALLFGLGSMAMMR
jgi:hypothetical protein